jgi:hypothetical protein
MSQTKAQLVSGTTAQDLTVDNINTTSINSGQTSGRKNLIINGAMNVAQRGTSSTSGGITTVDRFSVADDGLDANATMAQVDVASGTTPYSLGFRKAFKITNGNQTSGAGAGDFLFIHYQIEGQDVAGSGWNYTSASSFITLSFWVKSSVAQNFYGYVRIKDGTEQRYPYETGSLSADTWTKITKTIPGNSNIQIDNDTGAGMGIYLSQFIGTDRTDSGVTLNQWGAYVNGTRTPDQTSTWYTTNNATFEITGVQLEVGSTATDFEHRTFGEELALCQRYFFKVQGDQGDRVGIGGYATGSSEARFDAVFPVTMRSNPTLSGAGTAQFDSTPDSADFNCSSLTIDSTPTGLVSSIGLQIGGTSSMTGGTSGGIRFRSNSSFISFEAEL